MPTPARPLRLLALLAALGACSSPAPAPAPSRARPPFAAPAAPVLPAGLTACGVFGEVEGGRRCTTFDVATGAFVEADPLTKRAFLYDRWLDLDHTPEGQVANRIHTHPMHPGDPEATWADDAALRSWDGYGDSSLWTNTALLAAAGRYVATGTEADYARMEDYARAALRFFEATGFDGYQARFVFAAVPDGTPAAAARATAARDLSDPVSFDVPAAKRASLPAYFRDGVPDGKGGLAPVRASWRGEPSVDQYSGPLASFPIVVPLLKDRALAAALVHHFDCFARRLRVFRISHVSESGEVARSLAAYLGSLGSQLEPGEPDPSKVDELWGFYLPQLNAANAATYPAACPAKLAFDVDDEALLLDARDPLFEGKLVDLVLRQSATGRKDAMDFAFFPSVRSGDALQMLAIAQAGFALTGDPEYLRWHDDVLVKQAGAPAMAATIDAFLEPKACASYYREHNLVMSEYASLLTMPDGAERAVHERLMSHDLANRLHPTGNALFEIALAATTRTSSDGLAAALDALADFGGAVGHLDDPRRNFSTDNVADPLPGISVAAPTADETRICEAGATVFGITIPGDKVNPADRYADRALPLMRRVHDDFLWQRDPYDAVRHYGNEGVEQYPGLDLTLPYWLARAHGLLGTKTVVLAWQAAD